MTILITGFSGFVAQYFVEYLDNLDEEWSVIGVDINAPKYDYSCYRHLKSVEFTELNLLHSDALNVFFKKNTPDYILHLASFSSVAYSWEHPEESFLNNTNIFLNLVNAIQRYNPACRILSVGSSEEYGNVPHDNLPIRENEPLGPLSPYAVARVAQEQLSRVFHVSSGLNIIMTRSFNHIGPRQDDRFVVPSFIKRILAIRDQGKTEGEIETGDISIIRDFVDVRDVIRAYYILLKEGRAGEVYNICAGRRISLEMLIGMIAKLAGVSVKPVVNPAFVRPNDNKEIVGSYYKIESEFGWKPEIELEQTLRDMVDFYEKKNNGGG